MEKLLRDVPAVDSGAFADFCADILAPEPEAETQGDREPGGRKHG